MLLFIFYKAISQNYFLLKSMQYFLISVKNKALAYII